jgi:molybdenum cofactor cytidylyltransferase
MQASDRLPVVGVLLAAGTGSRFDGSGLRNKLLQPVNGGAAVAVASARHLIAACDTVLAVVRDARAELAQSLAAAGCTLVECADAADGMGSSIGTGMRAAPADGIYVIALADMPNVRPATIGALVAAIRCGADIAVPLYQDRRGNPVAFSVLHREYLMHLSGSEGARKRLQQYPVAEVAVADPGVLQDIDTPADLATLANIIT